MGWNDHLFLHPLHSWNTTKRVAEKWPELRVGWFRDGIDAWQEKGYPVEFLQQTLPMP